MKTAFALMLDQCGLCPAEAATVLGVRLDTVKKWSYGRMDPPLGVYDELRAVYAAVRSRADRLLKSKNPVLCLAGDIATANRFGVPAVGCDRAAAALALLLGRHWSKPPFGISPTIEYVVQRKETNR